MRITRIKDLLLYFSENVRKILLPYELCENITEIRLRTNRGISLRIGSENILLGGCVVRKEDIEYSFKAICDYSVYSFGRELSEGFITIKGGHRVGLCGTAVTENGKVNSINHISGMNFRIANERKGSADKIMSDIFNKEKCGIIIAGAPLSGKTTVLRDLCRQIGNKNKVSLIDERGEIAAIYKGIPQNDIGDFTDVFDGYPKSEGILTAIRTMSPDYIFVDEIGTDDDYKSIFSSVCCGVQIIATVHASSIKTLKEKENISKLLETGAFRYIVFLGCQGGLFGKITIEEVFDV